MSLGVLATRHWAQTGKRLPNQEKSLVRCPSRPPPEGLRDGDAY